MTNDQARQLGTWLANARRLRQMTQDDLAHASRVSRETIGKIERGTNEWKQGPDYSTVAMLEEALGVRQGTLRAVADGKDVPPHPSADHGADGELDEVFTRLHELRQLLEETGGQVKDLRRRVAALERQPESQGHARPR